MSGWANSAPAARCAQLPAACSPAQDSPRITPFTHRTAVLVTPLRQRLYPPKGCSARPKCTAYFQTFSRGFVGCHRKLAYIAPLWLMSPKFLAQ